MIERLEKMKDEGENSKKGLLSDEELGTLFTMLDPIEKGNLDKNQVKKKTHQQFPATLLSCYNFSFTGMCDDYLFVDFRLLMRLAVFT